MGQLRTANNRAKRALARTITVTEAAPIAKAAAKPAKKKAA
ncbi:MAG: hypothetical protein V4618_18190 [Pseudomonadota bacterium]